MKRHVLPVSALAIAATLALSACSTSSPTNGSSSSVNANGELKISLLTTYNGLPFYTAMQCGAQDAAKKLGHVTVTADGPSRGMNAADQLPVLEGVVNRQPDGLIFVPADPVAMLAPVQSAISAGIPVVTADAILSKKVAIAQFHGDNKAGGKLAADEMTKLVNGESGKILVLDNRPGLPVTNERAEGFIDAIKSTDPKLQVLPTQYFEDDPNKAATIVQSSMQANPDIVGIFTTAEAGAMGAVSGLEGVNGADKVSVIAYDAGPTLVQALKAGTLKALIAQGSYQQGYQALTALVDTIRKDGKKVPFDKVIKNVLVTKQNVSDPEVAKSLYPNKCS